MKNKIVGILTCIMLVLTAVIVIVPDDSKVEATSGGGGGDEGYTLLNTSYILSITEKNKRKQAYRTKPQ